MSPDLRRSQEMYRLRAPTYDRAVRRSLVTRAWRWAYGMNPMAGVVEGFRWALLGTPAPSVGMIVVSTAVTIVALFGGLAYFRRAERDFADLI